MAEYFINPYTFVGLRDGKTQCSVSSQNEKLTGKISCCLITKTQLAIPDLCDGKTDDGINKHPFYSVNGKAVIPGSSIRGVIRNVYEALTNSCMHINDKDDDYFSSRQNKQASALLAFENGRYVLYGADRIRITLGLSSADYKKAKSDKRFHMNCIRKQDNELAHFSIGDRVAYGKIPDGVNSVRIEAITKCDSSDGVFMQADLLINGNERKSNLSHNNPSVFVRKKAIADLPEDAIRLLELNVRSYTPTKNNRVKSQYENCFKKMKRGEALLPVWYYKREEKYYLSPSQMSRSFFFNKPRNILEKMGYTACTTRKDMCEACALFGMVGLGRNGEAVSSRVRFADAVCEDKDCFDDYYVLPILGGPRISSFEFYLKKKSEAYKDFKDRGNTFTYPFDPDEDDTVIAGRKFYWHHKGKRIIENDPKSVETAREATKNNKDNFSSLDSCVQLVKADKAFAFDVFFDGITEEQLKKLLFALTFGENTESSELCHKIGHGKPIGLGSVKIIADSIVIREYSNGIYKVSGDVKSEYYSKAEELFNKDDYTQVLKAVDMNAIAEPELIRYPVTPVDPGKRRPGDDAAFKWFAANRNSLTTKPGTIAFKRKLPDISSKDQRLPQDIRNESSHQSFEQLGGVKENAADESFSAGFTVRRRGQNDKPRQNKNDRFKKKPKW